VADMRKVLCFAMHISVLNLAITVSFAIFDRALLSGEFHLCSCFHFNITSAWILRQTRCSVSVLNTQDLLSPNWEAVHSLCFLTFH